MLNELLAAEKRSLLLRLTDTAPFVSSTDAGLADTIRPMIREATERIDRLSETIVALRGTLISTVPDPRTGSVHYVDLRYLLPRIIQDERRVLRVYDAAAERITDASARELALSIGECHRRHIKELGEMAPVSA